MVQVLAFCSLIGAVGFWKRRKATAHRQSADDGGIGLEKARLSGLNKHHSIDLGELNRTQSTYR